MMCFLRIQNIECHLGNKIFYRIEYNEINQLKITNWSQKLVTTFGTMNYWQLKTQSCFINME